jgi:outer membrane protein assembly factor BamB
MQRFRRPKLSQCVHLVFVGVVAAHGADYPQWRGSNRTGAISITAPKAWPDKLTQVWKINVGEGHSSPIVAGNRVFQFARVGEREVLAAYDLASGKKVWEHGYGAPYTMNPAAHAHGKGPKATPVAAGGKVCAIGITGTLTCIDASTGKLVWSQPNTGDALYGTASSPLIDGDLLVAQTGRQDNGVVIAYNLADGSKKWSVKTDGAAYSSPVIADLGGVRQVIVETQKSIIGVDVFSGAVLWNVAISTPYDQNSVTPIVVGDLVIYSGLSNPITAVRPARKGSLWAAPKVWQNKELGMYMNSPALAGGRLYGLSHRNKGQFFAIDPATGKTTWAGEGRQAENAAMLAAGNTIFALTTNSDLLIMPVSAEGLSVHKRYKVSENSETWAHPVILGDQILTKDKDSLTLWRLH